MSEEQKMEKRERILDAVRELLAVRRMTDVSVQDVASAAGVSVGVLYNYFRDKEEMIVAAAGLSGDSVYAHLSRRRAEKRAEEKEAARQRDFEDIREGRRTVTQVAEANNAVGDLAHAPLVVSSRSKLA